MFCLLALTYIYQLSQFQLASGHWETSPGNDVPSVWLIDSSAGKSFQVVVEKATVDECMTRVHQRTFDIPERHEPRHHNPDATHSSSERMPRTHR